MTGNRANRPHNPEAEAAVLGCVLLRQRILTEVAGLRAADFFNPRNGVVWTACRTLDRLGTPIDTVTIEHMLQAMGRLAGIGGLAYVGELAVSVPTADNAAYYADIVREYAERRRLLSGLSESLEQGWQGASASDVRVAAQRALSGASGSVEQFESSGERIQGEATKRAELVAREMHYGVTFLDDYLRGILPHDLIVIGAYTGAGKTQLVQLIAQANACHGKRVYLLALEAESDEIERRTKFSVLAHLAYRDRAPRRERLNYPDWYRGKCDDIVGPFEAVAEAWIRENLATLHTLYRESDFNVEHIEQQLRSIRDRADLIILDHLHYVDTDDANENRAVKAIIKRIRDVSLAIGVPVIVVAHLRKKDRVRRTLLPDIDDFHGSSDITKIATTAILISRAHDRESEHAWLANTYVQIPKSRMAGRCPYVGILGYDLRRNTYESQYSLGRASFAGDAVELLEGTDSPTWAERGVCAV